MQGLSSVWRLRLQAYERLFVGFSGGLDSTVLLHILASDDALRNKLQAVHVHHGLSAQADAWQTQCETFCTQLGVNFSAHAITLKTTANLEEAARDARMTLFEDMLEARDAVLLAHHADDQAETLLLNLLRGAGLDGLAAMPEQKTLGAGDVLRPFLKQPRAALLAYAKAHQLTWVEDESNQETHFSRNFLRHEILPKLKTRWPQAVNALNRCSAHASVAKQTLDALAFQDCPALKLPAPKLALSTLYALPSARLQHVLRIWLRQQHVKAPSQSVLSHLIDDVIHAKPDAMPELNFGSVSIRRYKAHLYLLHNKAPRGLSTEAIIQKLISLGFCMPDNAALTVRYRTGGETIRWRGHTRTLKKLFQVLGVPPWLRDTIPLVFIDNTLVAVLDFAIADDYVKERAHDTV